MMMKMALATTVLLFAGCTKDMSGPMSGDDGSGSGSGSGSGQLPPATGFQLVSPDLTIEAGGEHLFCWYFQTPNTTDVVINDWQSAWTGDASHHLIVYLTGGPTSGHPVGSAPTESGCGGGLQDVWTYAAQNSPNELQLPADDGNGKPLAQLVPAGSYGYIQMHYNNKGDSPVTAHMTVNANALAAGTAYTSTAAFITYVAGFTVPATNNTADNPYTVTNNCAISPSLKFWLVSTHAHKDAVHTEVFDGQGGTSVFASNDWEHPGAAEFTSNPFKTFPSGHLFDECKYVNLTGADIPEGQSAKTNEMCMATGYTFPATKPTACLNGNVVNF